METNKVLQGLAVDSTDFDGSESDSDRAVLQLIEDAFKGMDDDFNTAIAIASLNEIGVYAHKIANQQMPANTLAPWVLEKMKATFNLFIFNIFGLKDDQAEGAEAGTVDGLMQLILEIRSQAREQKDWGTSDKIRDALAAVGISIKDGKDGVSWSK
jgi:cysteinyl-tRNA synthetase